MNRFDMVFLDLDATLYDTPTFSREIKSILMGCGVSERDFSETIALATSGASGDKYNYTFELQLQLLGQRGYALPEAKVLTELYALFDVDRSYPDTYAFLSWCKEVSKKVVLLSAGNITFQEAKLRATEMRAYLDDLLIVSNQKEQAIAALYADSSTGLSVNDKLTENKRLKERWPNLTVITKARPEKYSRTEMEAIGCPYFNTLTDIQRYVTTHYA